MTPFKQWAGACALALLSTAACAQAWPSAKPIRLIIGYPPGGGIDFTARTVQMPLQTALGQQIVMDYKPGAGGMIAATELTRAAPDEAESAGAMLLTTFQVAISGGAVLGGLLIDLQGPLGVMTFLGLATLIGASVMSARGGRQVQLNEG